MLNPDTSSLSPSEKSNGVRLVSANPEISHIPKRGKNAIATPARPNENTSSMESPLTLKRKPIRIKAKLTS